MESPASLSWILCVRTALAAGIALVLHVVFYAACSASFHVNIFRPLSWIYPFFITLISPITWIYWMPSAIAMLLVGLATLGNVANERSRLKCRWDVLTRFITWKWIALFSAYALMSAAVPVAYLHVFDRRLTGSCDQNTTLRCQNKGAVFMFTCAMWSGLATITACFTPGNGLPQALINLPVNEFLRPSLRKVVNSSFYLSLKYAATYGIIYYLLGSYISSFLDYFLFTYGENASVGLLDIVGAWLLSWITCASVLNLKELLSLYLTQFPELPIPSIVAIVSKPMSLFEEQLVMKDLSYMAVGRSGVSTQEVFALSQPGGLPHNWTAILKSCLRVIETFQLQLNECYGTQSVAESAKLPLKSPERPFGNLRRLRPPDTPFLVAPKEEEWSDVLEPLTSRIDAAVEKFRAFVCRPVHFFTEPQQDLQICSLLENSESVMLAAKALSGLSCRALTEDRCGVMVNDLHVIINTLFSLEESLARITLPKKKVKSKLAETMLMALPVAVKQCITRIALTYSAHLDFLNLNGAKLSCLKRLVETGQDKEPLTR